LLCAHLQASQDIIDPPSNSDTGTGYSYSDLQGYVESWVFVSVPEVGVFSLREVLEIGTPGWQAFMDHGLPLDGYEPINVFSAGPSQSNAGVVVLMPEQHCLGDFNGDDVITNDDMVLFADAYFANDPAADLTGNGTIDIYDQFLFISLISMGCVVG